MAQVGEQQSEGRLAPVPTQVSLLASSVAVTAMIFRLSYPWNAFWGASMVACLWLLYLLRMRRAVRELERRTPWIGMMLWCLVAIVPTILFFSSLPVGSTASTVYAFVHGGFLLCVLIVFYWIDILGVPGPCIFIPLIGTFLLIIYMAGSMFVRDIDDAELMRDLHLKGYHWITRLDAQYLVRKTGRAAFRLPHCDHVRTLPGYREGSVASLISIMNRL